MPQTASSGGGANSTCKPRDWRNPSGGCGVSEGHIGPRGGSTTDN